MVDRADVLDQLPDAVLVISEGRVSLANAAAASLLGTHRDRIVGAFVSDLLVPSEMERIERALSQRADGWSVPETIRARFQRVPDRAEILADVRVHTTGAGAQRTLILCARDVTELTRAEGLMARLGDLSSAEPLLGSRELLQASEPIFTALGWQAALVEITPMGAIVQQLLNPGPAGDPVGDYGRSLLGKALSLDRAPLVAEVLRSGAALFLDNVPTLFGGPGVNAVALSETMSRARLTRTAWAPIRSNGKIVGILAVFGRDLSENDFVAIQLFAAQVSAADRMGELTRELVHRERLAAVGEMAAVLAHEIRNPTGVIANAAGALRRTGLASPSAEKLLAILSQDSQRLVRLVADMLDFAKPMTPALDEVSLGPLVRQSLANAQSDPGCEQKAVKTELDLPESLPPVRADPALLRRAVVNLLLNAWQHVPPSGRIRVAATNDTTGFVRLTVFNDGAPIPDEVASRVFEPFVTTRSQGTGLGLAVVRRVMESHHGRAELDRTDTGVQFSLWIPQTA